MFPNKKNTTKSCEQKKLKQNVVGKKFAEKSENKVRKKFEDQKQSF